MFVVVVLWICDLQFELGFVLTRLDSIRLDYTPNHTPFLHYSIMSENRNWMCQRLIDGFLNPAFASGVDKFLEFACPHLELMDWEKIKCLCQ